MSYYDALIAKWSNVQGADTAAKLTSLNAETVAGPRKPVPIANVMDYLRTNNLWLQIKNAAAAGTSVGATAAVDLNDDLRMQNINFDLPIVQGMLADLVAKSLLTQAQSDALSAMGDATQLWTQANDYPTITYGDLAMASLEGLTPWTHGDYVLNGPDANGNYQLVVSFWDTAAPATTLQFIHNTNSPNRVSVDSWAAQVMRGQANGAALAKLFG